MTTLVKNLGGFTFKKPLPVVIEWDVEEQEWIIHNDELTLEGRGKTYDEALKELEESLESLVVGFLAFEDNKLAEASIKIKEKLSEYLDLDVLKKKLGVL